ncbi:copper resistance protein B [Neptuniibacter sp. QD48_11]|uniref:copper resistance protein B n=1 Tax=Neptuniibacter sp. QD48_11 TaxID=3398211 RepID=UPI0039F5CEC1
MNNTIKKTLVLAMFALPFQAEAGGKDDPLLTMITIDQLEKRDANSSKPFAWEVQGWAGYDLDKFVFKTEGERADGETEKAELQLLYSKAIDPYWDIQFGIRHDFYPKPTQDWAVIALQGVAPYYFETDASLFIGEDGQTALRLESEYEMMLTQQWVLSPEIEVNFHGKNDEVREVGSGLSNIEAGLRLRYEVRREIAPYIGIHWEKKFGDTADFAREEGEDTNDTQFVMGIRIWF